MRLNLIASLIILLPFALMELINRSDYDDSFPVMLFAVLWVLSFGSITSVRSLIKLMKEKKQPWAMLGFFILAGVSCGLWLSLVCDQLPCFLGVENCD